MSKTKSIPFAPFPPGLTARQRLTLVAHVYKAVTRQHHAELAPLLRRVLPTDGITVDIGAHAGQFAKLLARIAPDGHVHAVEPGAYARFVLSAALRLNRIRNVSIHAVALSDGPADLSLAVPVKQSGSLGFGLSHVAPPEPDGDARCESVPGMTLDQLVAAQGLTKLDFIKVDIEGWEAHMLAGAEQTLRRFRPSVMIEIVDAHLRRADRSPNDVWRHFPDSDYRAYQVQPDGHLVPGTIDSGDGDFLFTCSAIAEE